MTNDALAQQLARLENQYEDAAARPMMTEGLRSAIVRHLPEAATFVDDFKVHEDDLMAASPNSMSSARPVLNNSTAL
jgi:hypothetical protein